MADNFGIYNLTAELEASPSASIHGALAPPSGNINLRRKPERDIRDRMELAEMTGSASGNRHAFYIPEVSSSMHEITSGNAFRSGTVPLETTAVPASGSLFYSKRNRFVKLTYALTASSGLATIPASQDHTPATDEYASRGTFLARSGSYRNTTIFNPSVFEINVPDHGKIRDVKVWVEFIHDHRGGPGTGSFGGNPFLAGGTGATAQYPKQGLQGVQVALRSPNVQFDYAHPLWNERTVRDLEKWPTSQVLTQYRKVPEIFKSSYLLWAGHSCEEDLGYALGSQTGSSATYLPTSNFTKRDITSSSIGPGINFANSTDYTSNYSLFNYYPGFRTISTMVWGSTNIGVLYPTAYGSPTSNENVVMFHVDTGTGIDPSPQQFYTSSFYNTNSPFFPFLPPFTYGFTMNNLRVRVQRNSPYLHAACISANAGAGVCIAYGQRQFGDSGAYPWKLKMPVIKGKSSDEAWAIAADSFFDFALDSNGKAHFVMNAWRGDLGLSLLNYAMFTDGTPNYNSTPTGATLIPSAGYPQYSYYRKNVVADHDAWPDLIQGELDNPTLNDPKKDSTPNGSVGAYCQIEIDPTDMIHVVYTDTQNRSVKYAKKPVAYTTWTGSWAFELVYEHPAPSTWPTYISLDLDRQNNPHIAYSLFDGVTDNIYYARSGSGGWEVSLVSTADGLKLGTRLKLDNNDSPHIVSTISNFDGDGNEGVILFTSSSQAGWAKRLLHSDPNDNPRETSLAFDVNNLARVYSGGGRLEAIWESSLPQQSKYNEYDTDIDMRTIFTDSSINTNPRNLTSLYENPTTSTPGSSSLYGLMIIDNRAYPSPFSASIPLLEAPGMWGAAQSYVFEPTLDQSNHLSGANAPWMFDNIVPPGLFHGLNYASTITSSLGLSPPPGWLTGPGGTVGVNEFPTTGSNLGPKDLQPVYPLLDDVFVEKVIDQPILTANSQFLPTSRNKLVGFRPGLRGTEINGIWKLLIGVAGDVVAGVPTGNSRAGIWFRQVRLEFLVDQGEPLRHTYASKGLRFKKSGVPQRIGNKRIAIMSGSAAWDIGINYVEVQIKGEYGRSVGITDQTGSDQFAVFSQITGSLVGLLSQSGGIYNVRSSYLANEFGTPYIPISSGSAAIPSFDTFDVGAATESRQVFATTLNPKTLIPNDNTLRAHLTRADVLKTTRDVLLKKISKL